MEVAHLIPSADEVANKETVIDLDAMGTAEPGVSDAIDRFLSTIQLRRRSADGDLTIRQSDLEFLAALLRSDRASVRRAISDPE
jgi:hypothetical protein